MTLSLVKGDFQKKRKKDEMLCFLYMRKRRDDMMLHMVYLGTIDRGASSVFQRIIIWYLLGSCLLETKFLRDIIVRWVPNSNRRIWQKVIVMWEFPCSRRSCIWDQRGTTQAGTVTLFIHALRKIFKVRSPPAFFIATSRHCFSRRRIQRILHQERERERVLFSDCERLLLWRDL